MRRPNRISKLFQNVDTGTTSGHLWPGFVDAFATVIMVVTFLLTLFVVTQSFMSNTLLDQDQLISRFKNQVASLLEKLGVEEETTQQLSYQLQEAESLRQAREAEIQTAQQQLTLANTARQNQEAQLIEVQRQLDTFNHQVDRLSQILAVSQDKIKDQEAQLSQQQNLLVEKDRKIMNLGQQLDQAILDKMQELAAYRSEFFGKLKKALGEREDMKVVDDRFVFQSEVLFPTGSAELSLEGQKKVKQLAQSLKEIGAQIPKEIPWILRVDGHTDPRPIRSAKYPSNWELSFARAMAVVRNLRSEGIPAVRLAAAGFGEHQPLTKKKNEKAYRANRRIEFKLDRR